MHIERWLVLILHGLWSRANRRKKTNPPASSSAEDNVTHCSAETTPQNSPPPSVPTQGTAPYTPVHRRTRSSSPYGFRRQKKKQPRTVCYKRPRKRLVNLYACDCGEVFCYEALRATSPRQGGAKSELSRGFPLKKWITKSRNSKKPHA